jgi:hypothetical protein
MVAIAGEANPAASSGPAASATAVRIFLLIAACLSKYQVALALASGVPDEIVYQNQ